MPSFPVPVLGFLFVSFHPSRLRSHSCSTGASHLFRFLASASFPGFSACFPLSYQSLPLASDYSAFCSFFSLLPDLPWQRFSRCATVSFVPFAFLFRFACFHASLPIPVLSFLRFLSPCSCFVSQALRSFWPPVSSSAIPLCFRFRFRLLGLSFCVFRSRSDLTYITTRILKCQQLFFIFLNSFLAFYNFFVPM